MWRCSECGAEVEDDFEVCWSCSTARSGASYEEFHATVPGASAPAPIAAPEVEQIAVLQAIEDGIGAIARHRVLLLAGMLLAASRLADFFFAAPDTLAVHGANRIALLLPLLRWQSVAWVAKTSSWTRWLMGSSSPSCTVRRVAGRRPWRRPPVRSPASRAWWAPRQSWGRSSLRRSSCSWSHRLV